MKIKYEAEVKDCAECDFYRPSDHYHKQYVCIRDGFISPRHFNMNIERFTLPCQVRPCPIEVKEIK